MIGKLKAVEKQKKEIVWAQPQEKQQKLVVNHDVDPDRAKSRVIKKQKTIKPYPT